MEMRITKNDLVAALGEFLGTAHFLFMGVGGGTTIAAVSSANSSGSDSVLATAFAFGISLMLNVWFFCNISGGVLNPAITVALMATRKLPVIRGLLYITAQFFGATAGSFFISLVLPVPIGALTLVASGTNLAQALFLEMFTTSVLTMAVFMLAVEKHGNFMAPFGIGLSLFISVLVAGPYTGASLNPARSFGPALIAGNFGDHWVYLLGPLLGSSLAAVYYLAFKRLNYENVLAETPEEDISDKDSATEKISTKSSSNTTV